MRTKRAPLLCELHAHTIWSDGQLTVGELVDLYGTSGFDVLAITDHVVRVAERSAAGGGSVAPGQHRRYLAEVEREADRARRLYEMIVIPGLELTYNDPDPCEAAHAVAIGCREHIDVDDGIEMAMLRARRAGAAIVAAHPHAAYVGRPGPSTRRFARDWRELAPLVDRYELFNGRQMFPWVAEAGLPAVASGDFHRPGDLSGWKTLLPCRRDEEEVVAYLRSERPAYVCRLEAAQGRSTLAA